LFKTQGFKNQKINFHYGNYAISTLCKSLAFLESMKNAGKFLVISSSSDLQKISVMFPTSKVVFIKHWPNGFLTNNKKSIKPVAIIIIKSNQEINILNEAFFEQVPTIVLSSKLKLADKSTYFIPFNTNSFSASWVVLYILLKQIFK